MGRLLSIIKNKQFIFVGANSSLASYSVKKLSQHNEIFGTFNSIRPKNSKDFSILKKVDLSKREKIENFVQQINKSLKNIILINFAVSKKDSLLLNVEEEEIIKSFQVNVFQIFILVSFFFP